MKKQTPFKIAKWTFFVVLSLLLLSVALSAAGDTPDQEQAPTPTPTRVRTESARALAPQSVTGNASSAPGYCPSSGGSTEFENISSVILTRTPGGTMKLEVHIYIANPTGCMPGEPCPEYDDSPEFINVWIDWNGDKQWQESEKVMDQALTGYMAINYRGTMTAVAQFTPPDETVDTTWLRANLGWDHDPNDPCEYSWEWGHIVDQQISLKTPKITEIRVKGCKWSLPVWPFSCLIGTPGDNPQTGNTVRLEAEIDVPNGYEITKCSWTGDLTPGEGKPKNKCLYDYTPSTGLGPAVHTYGPKDISLTVTYKHKESGLQDQVSKDHSYKVFFRKEKDDDGDDIPNWFQYWGANGAVPQLANTDVEYSSTLSGYGSWSPSDDKIRIGAIAADTHYPSGISVPVQKDICPGGTFGGAKGIDCATEVVVHEGRHKWIAHNWDVGGIWHGKKDSDEGVPKAGYDDDLPDDYETSTNKTAINNVDSCDISTIRNSPDYARYGDNEFAVMVYADGKTGNADKDWANPGKQSDSPYAFSGKETTGSQSPIRGSGPASSSAPYSSFTYSVGDMASLTGNYTDAGVDTDADGDFDSLQLSVGVQVAEAATYNVVAWLEDGAGTQIAWAKTYGPLNIGTHSVALLFDGSIIRQSGRNGPYRIARVELRTGDRDVLVDTATYPHVTQVYQYTDFDPLDAAFTGVYSDAGVDSNTDGLYDLLRIGIELDVQVAGDYAIIGELAGDAPITVASKTVTLGTGKQTISLDFSGALIFQSRQNGPYHLKALRIENSAADGIDFQGDAYTTSAYDHRQFQHSGTTLDANSYDDQGLDVDSDGDYDYLRIELEIDAAQAGNYRLMASLKDIEWATVAHQVRNLALAAGANKINLDFPGGLIRAHGVDGPYQVALVTLLSADGTIIDTQQIAHTTSAYDHTDFSPPLISLAGLYSDRGLDTDGDGLYDHLIVDVSVVPGDTGLIVAQGRLVDSAGNEIEWAAANTPMSAGAAQVISLTFTGRLIFENGHNGPFELWDLLVYHTGDPEQAASVSNAHSTASYRYIMFEGASRLYLPCVLSPQ